MNDDLADRLDDAEDALADTSPAGSLFTFEDADLAERFDADGSGAVFHLPREVTDNWGRLDADGRGDA